MANKHRLWTQTAWFQLPAWLLIPGVTLELPAWLLILGVTLEAIELEGLGFLICKMKRMLLATSEHFCEYLMSL